MKDCTYSNHLSLFILCKCNQTKGVQQNIAVFSIKNLYIELFFYFLQKNNLKNIFFIIQNVNTPLLLRDNPFAAHNLCGAGGPANQRA